MTGRLAVPELDIHTIADQLVPVQQENWYAGRVRAAADQSDLRQDYVLAAAIATSRRPRRSRHYTRWNTGWTPVGWDGVTEPAVLNAAVTASGLGPAAPYIHFQPPVLANARSHPTNGS